MSQSPVEAVSDPDRAYLDAFAELSDRIRKGASFSGRERNCAFLNIGGKAFADASAAIGLDLEQDSRGLAVTDWDHDGDLDLWLTNRTAPRLQLMQNQRAAGERRSLALLLQGDPAKGCPREAAGARVAVTAGGVDRWMTVHLGDGFLSQSSRWLHFGLDQAESVDRVVVHWPAGATEVFTGVATAGRFVLQQGRGQAAAWTGATPKPLEPGGAPQLPAPTETLRVRFSEPAQLPGDLAFENLAGQRITIGSMAAGAPVLLNLWASWCAPCLAELRAFREIEDQLHIVPLNVENLGGSGKISAGQVAAVIQKVGVRELGGLAGDDLIAALNQVVESRLYRHRGLSLPASFLLDAEMRVVAVYRGSVAPATLLDDLRGIGSAVQDVPFAGRWAREQYVSNPIAVANAYQGGGYLDDAREYLERHLGQVGAGEGASLRSADLCFSLANLDRAEGKLESAVSRYDQALALNPGLAPARILRVLSLADLGNSDAALAEVATLKSAAPGDPNFLNLEADVYRALGDDARAAGAYRSVLAINPRYIPAIEALAALLATSPDDSLRDGAEAVKRAEFLLGAPGARENPQFVITLADAYAEAGAFEKAVATARQALQLAMRYGDDETLERYRDRLRQFGEGKPYRAP